MADPAVAVPISKCPDWMVAEDRRSGDPRIAAEAKREERRRRRLRNEGRYIAPCTCWVRGGFAFCAADEHAPDSILQHLDDDTTEEP